MGRREGERKDEGERAAESMRDERRHTNLVINPGHTAHQTLTPSACFLEVSFLETHCVGFKKEYSESLTGLLTYDLSFISFTFNSKESEVCLAGVFYQFSNKK